MSIYKTEGCMVVLCDKSECFSTTEFLLFQEELCATHHVFHFMGKSSGKRHCTVNKNTFLTQYL